MYYAWSIILCEHFLCIVLVAVASCEVHCYNCAMPETWWLFTDLFCATDIMMVVDFLISKWLCFNISVRTFIFWVRRYMATNSWLYCFIFKFVVSVCLAQPHSTLFSLIIFWFGHWNAVGNKRLLTVMDCSHIFTFLIIFLVSCLMLINMCLCRFFVCKSA